MRINYRIISILLFSLAVSICAGSFFEASMTGSGKDSLENMLSGFLASGAAASFAECFFKVFVKNVVVLFLAFISPVIFITLPVLPAYFLLRGISFGFSAAMTLEVAGIRGVLHILASLVPQNLIQLPVYCFLAALSMESCAMRIKAAAGGKRKALQYDARRYCLLFIAGFSIITLSCIIEALLVTSV